MLSAGHETKRLRRIPPPEHTAGRRHETARVKLADQAAQQFSHFLGLAIALRGDIDNEVLRFRASLAELRVAPDIPLAQFDESSFGRERPDAVRDGFTGEAVEHDIDAAAAGGFQNRIEKIDTARVEHVTHAEGRQVIALFPIASGGEDFCAQLESKLHRSKPHPACGRVDQHGFARLHLRQRTQGIARREERARNARGFFKGKPLRLEDRHRRRCDRMGCEAIRSHGNHSVSDAESLYLGAERADGPGAFAAQCGYG